MGHFARPRFAAAGHGTRPQAGFTLAEVMVAMTLLLICILGTVKLIETGSAAQSSSRGREGATNIARELLEDAHQTTYATIGTSGWLTPQMQALNGGSGTVTTPATANLSTTVTRRGIGYTATVSWCSVDDSKDGYGPKSSSVTWCSDSTTVGTDASPEDMKRVTVQVDYTRYGRTYTVKQTVTFAATGGIVAPTVTSLVPSGPALSGPNYTITDGTQPSQVFHAVSNGAADMKFTVNGIEVTSGVAPNGTGNWDFTWQLAGLTDGTYTIGAVAVDALGNRSAPYTIQVKLARGAPLTAQNVVGGYNYVNPPGPGATGALVVELEWDANPEGSVTGYQVLRGATSVCGGQTSLANSCIDTNPPSSGTTTYTIKTWYRDANDVLQWVSANYSVTAPSSSPVPTLYGFTSGTSNSLSSCWVPPSSAGGGLRRDLVSNFPTSGGTTQTFGKVNGGDLVGCMPAFVGPVTEASGTGNVTFSAWFANTSNKPCSDLAITVYKNASTATSYVSAGYLPSIPANTSTPTRITQTRNGVAASFVAGDQLSVAVGNWTIAPSKSSDCSATTMYYGSGTYQSTITLPLTGTTGTALPTPNPPTSLTVVANADGTRTLTWVPPTSGTAVDSYRIYRDGTATANRVDEEGVTGVSPQTWVDTTAGGTTHTYRVTAVSANLAESVFLGPATG